ncbi:MAG: hypothetical protein A2189_03900 [Paenibacillus sp. RIFOXYA1_FULL_44_5]|nr:MAG: hypothetical protein A2189_03900 [Paenibacillus sp. RIFOXYA1_FULL_44_5]
MYQPLPPNEFFKNQHLTLLLRDKIGKYAVLSLRDKFYSAEPEELRGLEIHSEQLSVPFYDLFQLNTQVIDLEFEQALFEIAPTHEVQVKGEIDVKGYAYTDIIMRFPRDSINREFVEQLRFDADQLAFINFVAKKYELSLQDICRFLDEDDMFNDRGELQEEIFQGRANLSFRQGKFRDDAKNRVLIKTNPDAQEQIYEEKIVEMQYYLEVPAIFQTMCNIHEYNFMLKNEPYIQMLKRFFSKGSVPDRVLDIFEKISLNYQLNDEVINVLIHYLHSNKDSSWTKSYIESIAADMIGKQVSSFEHTVDYVREKTIKFKQLQSGAKRNTQRKSKSQKPNIPMIGDIQPQEQISEEQWESIRRKIEKLDGI